MGRRVRILSALVAGTLAFVVGTPTAYALDNTDDIKCQAAIAKEATSFVTKKLKLIQKCKDAELAEPGSCPTPDPVALGELEQKLLDGLAKKCSFNPGVSDDNHLATIGFPGPCPDVNPANGFTIGDLQACILATHNQVFFEATDRPVQFHIRIDQLRQPVPVPSIERLVERFYDLHVLLRHRPRSISREATQVARRFRPGARRGFG